MPDGNKQTSDGKTQTEPRTYVHITEEELSVNDVMAKVADTGCGGWLVSESFQNIAYILGQIFFSHLWREGGGLHLKVLNPVIR